MPNPSNITMAREMARRIASKLQIDVNISYAYGKPRAYTHEESRELSPRVSPKLLYMWLEAYNDGLDAMHEHCARMEQGKREALIAHLEGEMAGRNAFTIAGIELAVEALKQEQEGAPESYPQTIARLSRELQQARERANSLARELEQCREGESRNG